MTSSAAQRCGHCGAWMLPTDAVHYPVRRGETDAGNPLLGTVVDGKYRLQAVLGRGGLGTVFQAVHIGSLMVAAVKLLHPRFAERPEYRRALLPEARRAATVTHAHCARLLDVGEAEGGVAYLAMELVEGDTLEALMRAGRLAPSQVVEVLLQVADALAAIHAAGLVHCDLSPRNVMVATRGGNPHVKVLDFGIARTMTMAGGARGSEFAGFVNPVFSAPELLAGRDVDQRADVYSFGSLAWQLLTGSPPVDDSDARAAAVAVAEGRLRPWPSVPGAPRRLQRLVQQCVQKDPQARPASAAALRQELLIVRGARRPAVARAAIATAALAVMVTLAVSGAGPPPFLRPVAGSALELVDVASAATPVQHLQVNRLDTLGFHFGGFVPSRLRLDVVREGVVLLRRPLEPEVDAVGGTLTLSTAQPQWRDLLEGLVRSSRDGPVALSFVVPGAAPLGTARIRVDDEPPLPTWSLEGGEAGVLTGSSRLVWRCDDNVAVVATAAEVAFVSGRRVTLPLTGMHGTLELGQALAAVIGAVEPLGAGEVWLSARDPAGNQAAPPPTSFTEADVAAPAVESVTGPAGEPFVAVVGDAATMRVQMSVGEAGCRLQVKALDASELANVPLAGAVSWQLIEIRLPAAAEPVAAGPLGFTVTDRFGNSSHRQVFVNLRQRGVRVVLAGVQPSSSWRAGELVLAEPGGEAIVAVSAPHRLVRAELRLSSPGGADPSVRTQADADEPDRMHLHFGALPPGAHVLHLELAEQADGDVDGARIHHEVPLRVLPAAVELRVPAARSRFLPGVVQAGILTRRVTGYGEGAGWRIDPAWLPYVRGTLWVGAESLVAVTLPERTTASDPLLPDIVPVAGRNVLAVELRDVLDRPVRVLVGDGAAARREQDGHTLDVVADFWWHGASPEPIGEELLVEYGQTARLRLRCPLQFLPEERHELRLGIAQSEIAAAQVTPSGSGSTVVFDVPFEVWSVAAQLAGRGRDEFAEQLERRLDAYVATPAVEGRQGLSLRVRTARSTLQPVTLAELGELPEGLRELRLLPVLAPSGTFADPVPTTAPPRQLFRPQVSVAVRNMTDLLLQDREFTCGEARELVGMLAALRKKVSAATLVHRDDPLGENRLRAGALLPTRAVAAPADRPLTDVDFFQAWTLCRLLGVAVGGDPDLFRLPLGCELELAAYGATPGARSPSCHGAGASGGVSMPKFVAAAQKLAEGDVATAAESREAGDFVPTEFGADFVGLDFGVREWVADLPHVPGADVLLAEWIGDHAAHLARVSSFASGASTPPPDLAGALRTLGVVRGQALGELHGLVSASGATLDAGGLAVVPPTVPGVLHTAQMARDGSDLLGAARDARLSRVGFRVAGTAALLVRLRGRR